MKITTDILVHTYVSYFDINAAGPTLIKELLNIDLLAYEKTKRNIRYGKIIKQKDLTRYFPWVLSTFCKLICLELDGILYTQDSIVTYRDINESVLAKISIFTFKTSWKSKLLVIRKDKKAYFSITDTDDIIVKGDELPIKIIEKIYKQIFSSNNWLFSFKNWFQELNDITYFVTNKSNVLTYEGPISVTGYKVLKRTRLMNKINKQLYWNKLLPYIQSIYLYFK